MKVLLILVDGMRPDVLEHIPQAQSMLKRSAYTLRARTVMPSETLPCIMSLFHSAEPAKHGTTSNVFASQARPLTGLCELLAAKGKTCAFFYNWGALRDLARPSSLAFSCFYSGDALGYEKTNRMVADAAIDCLTGNDVDFAFLYLGHLDAAGHQYGWMSETYRTVAARSWEEITRVVGSLPEEYTVVVTSDHGGHGRMHGTDLPEDMTVPLLMIGKDFRPGKEIGQADIRDIAPTVAAVFGVLPDQNWEGKSLIC